MRLVVIGGSGYVGRRVVSLALERGHAVRAVSRSGSPPTSALSQAEWLSADMRQSERVREAVGESEAVISTLGAFGSPAYMRSVNGEANIAIARAAKQAGASRFVHISAADYGVVENLIPAYFEGKRAADEEISRLFGPNGTILRPGMIHGSRQVGSVHLPLWLIGVPLEVMLSTPAMCALRKRLGSLGGVLTPAISVDTVAAAAVAAATGEGNGGGGAGGASDPSTQVAEARVLDYGGMVALADALARLQADSEIPDLELFWDGGCPLCRREISYYRGLDREGRVQWTNIHNNPEALIRHGISIDQAMARIHAARADGEILSGVSAFLAVWERLPYWRSLPPLLRAVPGAVPVAESAYSAFARVRLRVTGRGMGGGSACAPAAKPEAGRD